MRHVSKFEDYAATVVIAICDIVGLVGFVGGVYLLLVVLK